MKKRAITYEGIRSGMIGFSKGKPTADVGLAISKIPVGKGTVPIPGKVSKRMSDQYGVPIGRVMKERASIRKNIKEFRGLLSGPSKVGDVHGEGFRKESGMDLRSYMFQGMMDEMIGKEAGAEQVVASKAARKAVGGGIRRVISKYPLTSAGTAVAGGAGAAAAVESHKDKQEALAKRREQVRRLLMQRLMHSGY